MTRGALLAALALTGCVSDSPRMDWPPVPLPPDPPASTEWHQEPVFERLDEPPIVVLNHADPSLKLAPIARDLRRQYDFLAEYVGSAPEVLYVHVGAHYPQGFMMQAGPYPEMFLQSGSIADTTANFAHEMMHAFLRRFGDLPHWFNESMSDVAYADSEIELWGRRKEAEFLATFDRVDHRSYELMRLRARYGRTYFRKVCHGLEARRERCLATFRDGVALEDKNELLLEVLSEAAGEDVRPLFREFGFNPKTRERQRGY